MTTSKVPPTRFVASYYDTVLQRALKHFFERATLAADAPSESSAEQLSVGRYLLRVPPERPFTEHEVRFARAIATVLEARYQAILNPEILVDRPELFRGALEDRYVGAFFDGARSERVAEVLEILRVAALSTYENHPISTGVMLLEGDEDPIAAYPPSERGWPHYTGALTSIKSFWRLADGVRTLFLVARDGRLLDIADISRWADELHCPTDKVAPVPRAYKAHACATIDARHVCIVLSPNREIKVFAEGAEVFTFRNADWRLLDVEAKYRTWEQAVGSRAVARTLFQTALDLSEAREGALLVVLRHPIESIGQLVAPGDRLDMELVGDALNPETPSRRHLLHVLAGRNLTELDASVFDALATLDGAVVADREGQLLAVGAILRHPPATLQETDTGVTEGARTTAAMAASRFGPVLKVSADGMITFFDGGRVWDI